jgi:S-adenosylmethionine uptake transporter
MSASARLPFAFAIGGIAILCGMDALIKEAGARYPTFQLAFLRFCAGFLCTSLAVIWLRPGFPSRETIRVNALRGALGAFTATTFFYSLQTLPLAEAIAFSFLSPLFLALFGALILREAIGRSTVYGLGFGFAGMLVMTFAPSLAGGLGSVLAGSKPLHLPGVGAAILSAVSYAFGLVLLRQRAQQDALVIIVLFQTMVPATLLTIPALLVWQPVPASDIPLFLAMGALGLFGHLMMAKAFATAEAARLAPSEYSALIFASILGYVFFSEVPGLATLAGLTLVIAGTVLAMGRR